MRLLIGDEYSVIFSTVIGGNKQNKIRKEKHRRFATESFLGVDFKENHEKRT